MSKDYRGGQSPAHLFAMELARGLRDGLGEGFVGIYLHGSVATGEDVPGKSDADLIAICGRPLPERARDGLCDLLTTSAPLPGLAAGDLGVLTARVAAHPERPVRWELMVRGKCAGDRLVCPTWADTPAISSTWSWHGSTGSPWSVPNRARSSHLYPQRGCWRLAPRSCERG
jgi:hypothetical protein